MNEPFHLSQTEVRPVVPQELLAGNMAANKQVVDNVVRMATEKIRQEVGVEKFTCYMCGKLKDREDFRPSRDPHCATGVSRVCSECASKIAHNYFNEELKGQVTVESVYKACSYLDIPWVYTCYTGAVEKHNATGEDIWVNYSVSTQDGNVGIWNFADSVPYSVDQDTVDVVEETVDVADEEYAYNRKDVVRMVGYDPFANYPVNEDKPQLYAQLISLIDEETKNDGMKMNAVIQIVKKLNQAEKLNDQMDIVVADTKNISKNMVLIDRMSAASQKLMSVANALAKDNGISANFNLNKSAGTSTLTGKIKKLTEIGLRSSKINAFDIGTCEGMRQVAEISEAARHKRIGYDENIAAEIKDIKVELVEQMTKERDEAKEMARRLLLENKDLKEFLLEKGLVDENYKVIENV